MVANMTVLHGWHHDDYDTAKRDIMRQLGDIRGHRLFGRQVMLAVYTRPGDMTASGLTRGRPSEQLNDWWEGKASLIISIGPSAFSGTPGYLEATYPDGVAPKVGDWVITNANAGIQMNVEGEGGERVKYQDRHGDWHDTYPERGWPCRVVMDDSILMTTDAPAGVV